MPKQARVTTRTGDRGETSLYAKVRVRKTDTRIDALGDLDEAQSAIGMARATMRGRDRDALLELQRGLYLIMAEVAAPPRYVKTLRSRIDVAAVRALDELADRLRPRANVESRFVVPGGDPGSASLDLARTVVRRAERTLVRLVDAAALDGTDVLPWMNRLSDVLFLMARANEKKRTGAKRDLAR